MGHARSSHPHTPSSLTKDYNQRVGASSSRVAPVAPTVSVEHVNRDIKMAIQKLRSDMGFNGDDMYHGHEVILVFRAIHTVYIPFIIKQVFSIPKLIDIAS